MRTRRISLRCLEIAKLIVQGTFHKVDGLAKSPKYGKHELTVDHQTH